MSRGTCATRTWSWSLSGRPGGAQRCGHPRSRCAGRRLEAPPCTSELSPSRVLPCCWQTGKSCVGALRGELRGRPLGGRRLRLVAHRGLPSQGPGSPAARPAPGRRLSTAPPARAPPDRGSRGEGRPPCASRFAGRRHRSSPTCRGRHPGRSLIQKPGTGPLAVDTCCRVNRLLGWVGLQRTEGRVAQVTPPAQFLWRPLPESDSVVLVVPETLLPASLSPQPACQERAGEQGAHEHGPDLQGRSAGVRGLRPEQAAARAAHRKACGCGSRPWAPVGLRVPAKSQGARRSDVAPALAVAEGGPRSGA